MNTAFAALLIFFAVFYARADEINLPVELRNKIENFRMAGEASDKSDYVKFIRLNKSKQNLNDYLKLGPPPILGNLEKSIKSIRAFTRFERQYIKSLNKEPAMSKEEKLKGRYSFLADSLGRVEMSLAATLVSVVYLKDYGSELERIDSPSVKKWLETERQKLKSRHADIIVKLATYEIRQWQSMLLFDKDLHLEDKSDPETRKKLVLELEKQLQSFAANKSCLASASCFYCGNSIEKTLCSTAAVEKRTEKWGANWQSVFGKVAEGIQQLNKRM